jgi:acyl carrier protein
MAAIDSVRDFIVRELQWTGNVDTLTEDYPLIANHVLDSVGLLTLIAFLEDQFGVDIADNELVPDNFSTLGKITSMIDRKQAVKTSAP